MIHPLDHFTILSSHCFTWSETSSRQLPIGVCEESDLRAQGHRSIRAIERQVFDDACDVGFVVRSDRTNTHVLYTHLENLYNPREPDELQVWIYKAHKQWDGRRQRWVPVEKVTEVHILND
jgi:hypothetical protein